MSRPAAVYLTDRARKDLERLPSGHRQQIIEGLRRLGAGHSLDVKRLRGYRPPVYRMRSGDFRILFRRGEASVHILAIIDRQDLERELTRLFGGG
ncbi:MAG: type II toxin-antitoxin system RelE/ParE family toxin [Armatimonadetes bacterium]|nr:type II toxin-antitoxin system RelE/ParE family toxin [Armatimonadota bacterium]